jgi:hypothetical protein
MRRERRSSHKWVSKDRDQREEQSHTEVSVWDFHTHMWVSEEIDIDICGSYKGKEQTSMGQRRESHECIGKHAGIRLYRSTGVSKFV